MVLWRDQVADRQLLLILAMQYLLTEVAPGRYRTPDLIWQHARDLAAEFDPVRDREQPSRGCWATTSTPPPWPER